MAVRIQFRRGTFAEWDAVKTSVILAAGELGYESTNKLIKFGDGVSNWETLEVAAAGDITAVIAGSGLQYDVGTTGYGNAASAGFSGVVQLKLDTSVVLTSASIDAKGDLLVGTADNTYSKQAIGTNGKVLTADSTQSTGVAWTQIVPVGVVQQYAGTTAPAGYLLCNGASFSSVTYGDLATVVGDTYGTHSGTTYYLPDLRTRIAVGQAASGTFATLGATGGAETHTLTTAQLALHSHPMGSVTATATGSAVSITGGDHSHPISDPTHAHGPLSPNNFFVVQKSSGNGYSVSTNYTGSSEGGNVTGTAASGTGITVNSAGHSHTLTVTQPTITPTVAANTGNTGSGSAHNNLQPYIVLNYIIKT